MLSLLLLLPVLAAAQDGNLIFQDEFDGGEIDMSKWSYEISAWGGGNEEFQVYVDNAENSYVEDGKLFMRALPLAEVTNPATGEPYGEDFLLNGQLDLNALYGECTTPDIEWSCFRDYPNIPPIASSRLHTTDKFSFRYGYVEISAKMPVGDWLWPAMWLLPQDWAYGGWPMSGEIDIVEIIGNRQLVCDGTNVGIQKMGSALHWGAPGSGSQWPLTHGDVWDESNNFGDNFHKYVLEWEPNGLRLLVDDVNVMDVPDPWIPEDNQCWTGFYDFAYPSGGFDNPWTDALTCHSYMAPFDQKFYLILNVAVGGVWFFPDGCVNGDGSAEVQKPWANGGGQSGMAADFYNAKEHWEPTWTSEGDNNAMQIDYIRVYQRDSYDRTETPNQCAEMPGPDNCPA
jgi:beta-glucanase (GH16 family)